MATTKIQTKKKAAGLYPVVSLAAEFLVMGQLMRRNILSYKAPHNYEGYDVICIHPNPKNSGQIIRVQVKGRSSTNGWGFPIKQKSLVGFDFLIFVRLNIYKPKINRKDGVTAIETRQEIEFYTLTSAFIKVRHNNSSYPKVNFSKADRKLLDKFKNEKGFDLIADKLKIKYPDNDTDSE